MSCKIEYKAKEHLKGKKIIDNDYNILNMNAFKKENDYLTNLAYGKYNVGGITPLYTIDTSNKVKAIPNMDLFNILDEAVSLEDTEKTIKSIENLSKPSINIRYKTNSEIVNLDNPREYKLREESLKEDVEKLNNLINCLWK